MPRTSVGRSNPTNLIEISKSHITLTKKGMPDQETIQLTKLDLSSYDIDVRSRVFIVAHAGNTSSRFDFGTVSNWKRTPQKLEGLDSSKRLKFRILVRNEGAAILVASAENLYCAGDGDTESLLPIQTRDLGQKLWQLEIDSDGATLICNNRNFQSGSAAIDYAPFSCLVIPEVFRQVAQYIAENPDCLSDESTDWAAWKIWMTQIGIVLPEDDDDDQARQEWVTATANTFCEHHKFSERLIDFESNVRPS